MSNAEKSNSPRGARGRGRGRGLQRATPPERPRGRVEPDSEVERILKSFRNFDPGLTAIVRFDSAFKAIEIQMVFDGDAFVRAGIEPEEGLPIDRPSGGLIHTQVQAHMVKKRLEDHDRNVRRSMRSTVRLGRSVKLSQVGSLSKEDLSLLDMPASQYEKLHGKSNQRTGDSVSSGTPPTKVSRAQEPMGSAAPSTSTFDGQPRNSSHQRKWSDEVEADEAKQALLNFQGTAPTTGPPSSEGGNRFGDTSRSRSPGFQNVPQGTSVEPSGSSPPRGGVSHINGVKVTEQISESAGRFVPKSTKGL